MVLLIQDGFSSPRSSVHIPISRKEQGETNFLCFLKNLLIGGKLLYKVVSFCHTMYFRYNDTFPASLWSLPCPDPSRSSQSTSLGSRCYVTASHKLSARHNGSVFIHPTLSFPPNRLSQEYFLEAKYNHICFCSILQTLGHCEGGWGM